MQGDVAIDPESGAPLAREREFPFDGSFHRGGGRFYFHDPPSAVSARTPDPDEHTAWDDDREGALTTGEPKSSVDALKSYFKREADAHGAYETDVLAPGLTAFEQLKLHVDAIDEFVWYAAAERIHRKGAAVPWMVGCVVPKCPHCRSDCKPGKGEVRCASSPNVHGHVRGAIHERVAELYGATWGEEIERLTFMDAPGADA